MSTSSNKHEVRAADHLAEFSLRMCCGFFLTLLTISSGTFVVRGVAYGFSMLFVGIFYWLDQGISRIHQLALIATGLWLAMSIKGDGTSPFLALDLVLGVAFTVLFAWVPFEKSRLTKSAEEHDGGLDTS